MPMAWGGGREKQESRCLASMGVCGTVGELGGGWG